MLRFFSGAAPLGWLGRRTGREVTNHQKLLRLRTGGKKRISLVGLKIRQASCESDAGRELQCNPADVECLKWRCHQKETMPTCITVLSICEKGGIELETLPVLLYTSSKQLTMH